MIPSLYLRYQLAKAIPSDLLKPNMTIFTEPVFHLYPTYLLTPIYSPSLNPFNGIYVSFLLPHVVDTPTVVLRSEATKVINLGGSPNRIRIEANPTITKSLKVLSRWETKYAPAEKLAFEMEVDPKLIMSIRYVVVDSQLLMIEMHNNIVKLKLNEPTDSTHIARVSIVNEPESMERGTPFGVIGVHVYRVLSKQDWGSTPITAAAFSLTGCHVGPEYGLYSLSEERNSVPRCILSLSTSGENNRPWLSFMQVDERMEYRHTSYAVPEFSYFNETSCFDQYVDWTTKSKVYFGRGARLGLLYWKNAMYAQSLGVEFNLSWYSTLPGFCMWWLCTTALPKHRLLTTIAMKLYSFCSSGSLDPIQIDIPFHIQSSLACITLNRGSNGSFVVRYVHLTARERCQSGDRDTEISPSVSEVPCLDVSAAEEVKLENELFLQIYTHENNVIIRADGKPLFANAELFLPSTMCQPQTFVLSGFAGSSMAVSRYEVASAATQTSFILVPSSDITLQHVATMEPKKYFNTVPCHVTYRDHVAYGSTDPSLGNPILYNMNGYVFAMNETNQNYGILAWDDKCSLWFYMELHANIHSHSFVAVNHGITCTVKRVKVRMDSDMSCFGNNRLVRFGCNSSGLINYNNTCFQNSALQLLFHSDSFKRSLFRFYQEYIRMNLPQDNDSFICMQALILMLTRLQISIRAAEFNDLMLVLQKRFDLGYQHVVMSVGCDL